MLLEFMITILERISYFPSYSDGDETCERRANDMLNRNKVQPKEYSTDEGRDILNGADVIIVDGDVVVPKQRHQIVLHVVAALPGDKVFGHLPHDCDEGLLLALTGFFTGMSNKIWKQMKIVNCNLHYAILFRYGT